MGRFCSVYGCHNSSRKLNIWLSQLCHIHGQKYGSCICHPPFELFPFPLERNDPEGRQRWTKLVNRKQSSGKIWTPNVYSRVCSIHFKDKKPTTAWPDPTENMGYEKKDVSKSPRNPPKERPQPVKKPKKKRKLAEIREAADAGLPNTESYPDPELQQDIGTEAHHHLTPENCLRDHDYICVGFSDCNACTSKRARIEELESENKDLKRKLRKKRSVLQPKFDITKCVLTNDKNVKKFTGMESKEKLEALHNYLQPNAEKMRYWKGQKSSLPHPSPRSTPKRKTTPQKPGPARSLSSLQEFILVLMKLRMALTIAFLGSLFGISVSTASQVFNTWIKFLAYELKPLIYWPDRDLIFGSIPHTLKGKYTQLRCTIDCTEIFIGRPRNFELQALTWSDYKRHNTVKFLVAIAPNGMISFLSKAWGGRASDVLITRESKFLELIDPGDIILADRGFIIKEDLLLRGARLEIPPPSKGIEQQTPTNVQKTKKIANARIHVERVIGRMKIFSILQQTLPVSLVPLIDDIATVCAALVNLQPAIVK